jgi:peptide/nickel transport system permease protein
MRDEVIGGRRFEDTYYVFVQNKSTFIAAVLFAFIILMGIFGPSLVPFDPLESNSALTLKPPSFEHWFGTDALGRDILSRIVVATQLDLEMALGAVILAVIIGTSMGMIAGYFGGLVDAVTSRLMDTIMAFPLFVLAMGIVAALGETILNVVIATAIINIPFYARFARDEVHLRRDLNFVEAARMGGNRSVRVIFRHIFPNILPLVAVRASMSLGWSILNAAGLSFIGLGVHPPTPEWGIMVADGANYVISGEYWTFLFPGLALVATVFCFNLLGDGIRDALDPRNRR